MQLKLSPIAYLALKKYLQKDPQFLKEIGDLIARDAQENFKQQSFQGKPWLKRYPNQAAPKLNIAGIISDFNRGISPKGIRFQDSPVGFDTGALFRSLSPAAAVQVAGRSIYVGSNLDYAQKFAEGGISTQPISLQTKKQIRDFLKKNPEYTKKLKPLTKPEIISLTTSSPARPFLGLSNRLQSKIEALILKRANSLG